jgi:hypothetical protein
MEKLSAKAVVSLQSHNCPRQRRVHNFRRFPQCEMMMSGECRQVKSYSPAPPIDLPTAFQFPVIPEFHCDCAVLFWHSRRTAEMVECMNRSTFALRCCGRGQEFDSCLEQLGLALQRHEEWLSGTTMTMTKDSDFPVMGEDCKMSSVQHRKEQSFSGQTQNVLTWLHCVGILSRYLVTQPSARFPILHASIHSKAISASNRLIGQSLLPRPVKRHFLMKHWPDVTIRFAAAAGPKWSKTDKQTDLWECKVWR